MDDYIDKIKKIIYEELAKYKGKTIWIIVESIGKAVGVKGDQRIYGDIIVISIRSEDDNKPIELPWYILRKIQSRICQIKKVTRVLYDLC